MHTSAFWFLHYLFICLVKHVYASLYSNARHQAETTDIIPWYKPFVLKQWSVSPKLITEFSTVKCCKCSVNRQHTFKAFNSNSAPFMFCVNGANGQAINSQKLLISIFRKEGNHNQKRQAGFKKHFSIPHTISEEEEIPSCTGKVEL